MEANEKWGRERSEKREGFLNILVIKDTQFEL